MSPHSPNLSTAAPPASIGYVLKRFPRLSETFILNELLALQRLGTPVDVYALGDPREAQHHRLLRELRSPVYYLPPRQALCTVRLRRLVPADGARQDLSLREVAAPRADEEGPYPGKRFAQCQTLQMQAAALACAAQARGVQHLHAHFASDAATVAMLASRLSGIGFSFTAHAKDIYHSYSHPQWDRAFLRDKLRAARFVVTVSDYNRDHLQALAGPGRATVHRLYNGVDLQRLAFHVEPREPALILAVGRLVEKKGFRYLIEACARLQAEGLDFRCEVIGDGPERADLAARIAAHGLAERITLRGALPQEMVLERLRRAALFVLPCVVTASGDRDGLPTVLLEAMALGTPAVSTRVAGIPEIIDDGVTGRLVPPADPAALARALGDLLCMPAAARLRLARQARRKAERLFDLHANVRALNALFATRARDAADEPVPGTG